jgi:hypothetical protein
MYILSSTDNTVVFPKETTGAEVKRLAERVRDNPPGLLNEQRARRMILPQHPGQSLVTDLI